MQYGIRDKHLLYDSQYETYLEGKEKKTISK